MIARAVRRFWREGLLVALLALPWLALVVLGILWLREHGVLLEFALGAMAAGLLAWPLRRAIRTRARTELAARLAAQQAPDAAWTATERQAWADVAAIADAARETDPTDQEAMLALARRTVEAVAARFHPGKDDAAARVTLPELLLLTERVARDLRGMTLRYVVGARSLRLDQLLWAKGVAERWGPAGLAVARIGHGAWRVGRAFLNPQAAIVQEIARGLDGSSQSLLAGNLREAAIRAFVQETGRVAIELYAGRLRLSSEEIAEADSADRGGAPSDMPVRILLAGQAKAGRSSLANAMAGTVIAEVSSVPLGGEAVENALSVEGQPAVILVETPGLTADAATREAVLEQAARADAVIWVASATQPARQADAAALAALRARDAADPAIRPPPLFVALTHVDRLRPAADWHPPYDPDAPRTPKETSMREAIEAAAAALGVPVGDVVPVAVPEGAEPWNEHLVWGHVAARLDEARRRRLERLRAAREGFAIGEMAGQVWRSAGWLARKTVGW
jgi:predicted GTPase